MKSSARGRAIPSRLFAVALAAALAAGCGDKPPAPQQVVQKPAPKAQAVPPVSPKAEEKKAETPALYDPAGKRDPFVSFIKEEVPARGKDAAAVPPLLRYELGELKLVGILWTKAGAKALVEDAEGKGYSVVTGSRIGRSGGVVTRITEKEVIVREEFTGLQGRKVVRENAMQLTTAGGKE